MSLITGEDMRHALILFVCLCTPCVAQELPEAKPEVQNQIKKTYDSIRRLGIISYDNVEVFAEAQKVKELIAPQEDDDDEALTLSDQVEVMEQLAVFVATTESSEDTHVLLSLMIWRYLQISPEATIQVLAPYLDASDESLRRFAHKWLAGHDDWDDYKKYVSRSEEIPAPLIKLLYERSPGQALLLFQSGNVAADVQAAIKQLEGNGREAPQKPDEGKREILLGEHVVSDALWLHKNKFDEQFQAALPEAMAALEKLANHKQWLARLYVVHIMRQNPTLLQDHILRRLAEDENALVSEAAMSGRGQ
jgi:hypothetical protein